MTKKRRKTKYEQDPDYYNTLAEKYAREGCIDTEIVKKLEISLSAFYDWQKKFPDFKKSLKNNKIVVDKLVEDSLLKRALGYSYTEVKQIIKDDVVIQIEKFKKSMPPDVTAQIFWLKNRDSERWKDMRQNNNQNKNTTIETVDFEFEELKSEKSKSED